MSSLAGLSSIEARSRFEANGPNEIVEKGGRSLLKILIDQFTNVLVLLLVVAAIVAYLTGEKIDAGLIIGIVILNGVLGFVQEYKAEDAIKKLKGMGAGKIRVRRDGMDVEIESREIVVGDVVFVEEGLRIPADGVVLESTFLEVNESVLTGESMPIAKEVGTIYAGQLYSGTIVSRGKGWMGVEETGMNTKFGKLAESLKSINSEETPLEQKLKKLSGVMVGIGVVGCLAVVLKMGLLGREWMLAWASGVSLAVAVIPEGLPAVLAITLAMGVTKMAREKAVMRKLAAVEALGGASVIATDKTGTITKNEMEVKRMEIDGDEADLMRCGVLASTAVLVEKDNGEWDVIGDQTEGAVLKLATSHNIDIEAERVKHTVIAEYPFDSKLKLMSVVVDPKNTKGYTPVAYAKGAPEIVWSKCKFERNKKGELKKFDAETIEKLLRKQQGMAAVGLRVLGFAMRNMKTTSKKLNREEVEKDLVWLGMVGIADPLRPEAARVIKEAGEMGVKVVVITGDNELTAKMIAREAGLIHQDEEIMSGDSLEKITDEALIEHVSKIRIFARISPDQKLRIVKALQRSGEVVVMTGDGVNDALAIKQADVGVAMGKGGTDVARETADMVLLDDNLDTILKAISNGRKVIENITATVKYLLACNVGEVGTILTAIFLGMQTPLLPVQILWVNLVTDGLPALALAVESSPTKYAGKTRIPGRWLIGRADIGWLVGSSVGVTAASVLAFMLWGRAGAFTMLVLSQMMVALLVRGFNYRGKLLMGSIVLAVGLQLCILYFPGLRSVFRI